MSSIEHIEMFRSGRDGLIISRCVLCNSTAWTDYYGNYSCKSCLQFFFECIQKRKLYVCNINRPLRGSGYCQFCKLQNFYRLGFKPIRFGRHEHRWWMKDTERFLKPVTTHERFDQFSFMNNMVIHLFFKDKLNYFKNWLRNNPPSPDPISETQMNDYINKYSLKGIAMKIAVESLHIHDVILIENHRYWDPYQCATPELQDFGLRILEIIRFFRNSFLESHPPLSAQKKFIYSVICF